MVVLINLKTVVRVRGTSMQMMASCSQLIWRLCRAKASISLVFINGRSLMVRRAINKVRSRIMADLTRRRTSSMSRLLRRFMLKSRSRSMIVRRKRLECQSTSLMFQVTVRCVWTTLLIRATTTKLPCLIRVSRTFSWTMKVWRLEIRWIKRKA